MSERTRTSPTVRRRRLASLMRAHREAAGVSKEAAAGHAGISTRTVTRMEAAEHNVSPAVTESLARFYGLPDEQVAELVKLCRESRRKGWWHVYADAIPDWFEVYIGLEEEVSELRTYQPELVFGVLQTEEYFRALNRADLDPPRDEELERRVAVRLRRQERVTGEHPVKLRAVLNEAVLHRRVGGPEVMREQLLHLVKLSHLSNVTIQVLPFVSGAHPGVDGCFNILRFPEPADPDVVYLQSRLGSVFLERPEGIAHYAAIFDHLQVEALNQEESRALITQIADGMN